VSSELPRKNRLRHTPQGAPRIVSRIPLTCGRLEVLSAIVTPRCFRHDPGWMVIQMHRLPFGRSRSLGVGGWPTSAPGKYNSQEEYSFSILGCPMVACFWQTWDLARRTNLSPMGSCSPDRNEAKSQKLRVPHFSRPVREVGPDLESPANLGHPLRRGEDECNREWLLKNFRFVKIAGIWEIENVCQNGDRRL
jgi:hypothetical protein